MLNFDLSSPWRELSLVSVDVETTGLDTSTSRVIEVAIVRFERGQVADRWASLVHPGIPVPPKVTEITGIKDEMLEGKPTFRDLKWDVFGRLRDKVFVAYNSDYDWQILDAEMARIGLTMPTVPVLDPLVWARQLLPNERRHRLGAIAGKLGIEIGNAHRAEDDAEAAGKVLFRLADKVPLELGALLDEQAVWKQAQEAAFAARRAERAAKAAARAAAETQPTASDPTPVPEITDPNQTGMFG